MSDIEDGGTCPTGCGGTLVYPKVENCSCHINPPCSACTDNLLTCPACGWKDEPPKHEPPTPAQAEFYRREMERWKDARRRGHTFPHGGRVFNVDHDGRSGSTHVITGEYEGPVTAADILARFGDGTFGHRGPTLHPGGRFTYTKITD